MSEITELDSKTTAPVTEEEKNIIKTLEEDDEFEDFPEDDSKWSGEGNKLDEKTLWEEDWDDDDTQDQFAAKLKKNYKNRKTCCQIEVDQL